MKTDFPKIPLPFPKSGDENKKLALYGGPPVIPINLRKTIFPITTKEDILRMILSLSDTSQNIIDDFSDSYRRYIGANYAIPTSSGTFSIMLALIGVGVKPGDEVIIPAFTFIATAQAVVAAKAIPIFVDIDPKTYCIDPKKIENKIGKKTTAIMPVHLHGLPANINLIKKITSKYNLKLVEDASHAHSSTYSGKLCGSLGDAAGQSLMADKNFPVGGEGGITLFKESDHKTCLISIGEEPTRIVLELKKTYSDIAHAHITYVNERNLKSCLPYLDSSFQNLIVIEEHRKMGGIGSSISLLAKKSKVHSFCLNNNWLSYGGSHMQQLNHYGLTCLSLVEYLKSCGLLGDSYE